jgi:hypothetical protein
MDKKKSLILMTLAASVLALAIFRKVMTNPDNDTAVLAADNGSRVSPALVDLSSLSWIPPVQSCIKVCTRFCRPTGWDCCKWETRCRYPNHKV